MNRFLIRLFLVALVFVTTSVAADLRAPGVDGVRRQ
jgi:hypothetical protein